MQLSPAARVVHIVVKRSNVLPSRLRSYSGCGIFSPHSLSFFLDHKHMESSVLSNGYIILPIWMNVLEKEGNLHVYTWGHKYYIGVQNSSSPLCVSPHAGSRKWSLVQVAITTMRMLSCMHWWVWPRLICQSNVERPLNTHLGRSLCHWVKRVGKARSEFEIRIHKCTDIMSVHCQICTDIFKFCCDICRFCSYYHCICSLTASLATRLL